MTGRGTRKSGTTARRSRSPSSSQGWLRDGVTLWKPGDNVFVKSPMAMLNMTMKIQNVAFSQDNQNGTITTLDLVPPWLLKDRRELESE